MDLPSPCSLLFCRSKEIGPIPEPINLTVSLRGSHETEGNYQIVRLTGLLDSFSEPNFRKEVGKLVEAGPKHLILDMTAIDFVDSSGIGALVQLAKTVNDSGTFQIVANPRVTQTVKVVRLEKFLSLCKTLEEAKANVPNG